MSVAIAGCVSVDGRLLAPHEATVSALDAGFLLGDGLFESLRAVDGAPYLLDRHVARLLSAASELGYVAPPSHARLVEEVGRVLDRAALPDAYVRITLTRGRSCAPPARAQGPSTAVVAALAAPARSPARGIAAILIGPPGEPGSRAKSTSRQYAVRAQDRVLAAGADEGIHVAADGRVLEGIASNVFAVLDGTLLTPRKQECLPGITRGRVLELAREAGVELREAPVERERLLGADEVFVTNAVQGPRPVRSIDGEPVSGRRGDGGALFSKLLALYEADRARTTPVARSGASPVGIRGV